MKTEHLQIAILGKRNAGKSTLLNAITQQDASVVSPEAGTTTDAVVRSMELHGVGAVLLIDTPGFDDEGELGRLRVERTRRAVERCDVAVMVCDGEVLTGEAEWCERLRERGVPIITVVGRCDERSETECEALRRSVTERLGVEPLMVSAVEGFDIEPLRRAILAAMPEGFGERTILGDWVERGDVVVLVMPQDPQAPKGRLILPQMQTLRELLDRGCRVLSVTGEELETVLGELRRVPRLIITDSQKFREVKAIVPEGCRLTSFSILMARYKGDIDVLERGAHSLLSLTERSRVLIAEACTHAPMSEDIGRVKLPRILRARVGEGLTIDIVSGRDFPDDLTPYDLVIHCGGCMFNRKYMMSRIEQATQQGVAITNYGLALFSGD